MVGSHRAVKRHTHRFESGFEASAARRVRAVMLLTLAIMIVEIVAGTIFNSMALLADGWHMWTHASAFGISALAYAYSKRHADDPRFTFGTGKISALAGFASAVVLTVAAALIAWDSVSHLLSTPGVAFDGALAVALAGLMTNLVSAVLLRDRHHASDHHHSHRHDHILVAAYAHVLADALTSVLAIASLLLGKYLGWWWADPTMGIFGASAIAWWGWLLMRHSGAVLVDYSDETELPAKIRSIIERDGDTWVSDLHLWTVGPGRWAVIIELSAAETRTPAHYKKLLSVFGELCHITVEVNSMTANS